MLDYLKNRKKYTTHRRDPFYEIIKSFLPSYPGEIIIDAGCGKGGFYQYLNLKNYDEVYLLDSEIKTINYLQNKKYGIPLLWYASERIDLPDNSVSLLNTSHMIEHLMVKDLAFFISEIDRVVKPGGHVCISGPLLYEGFYEEITHLRPIPPDVFFQRLCNHLPDYEFFSEPVSTDFKKILLQYRWKRIPLNEGYQHSFNWMTYLLFGFKYLLRLLGFQKFIKTGYLLVLQKKE